VKKTLLIVLKWLIIAYLASQAFFEIDLLQTLSGALIGWHFEVPLGLNITNFLLFGFVGFYIVRREWGRAKQIRYSLVGSEMCIRDRPSPRKPVAY